MSEDTPTPKKGISAYLPASWKIWAVWAAMTCLIVLFDHIMGLAIRPPMPPDFGLHEGDSYSFGWVQKPADVQAIVAGMKIKTFGDTPAGQSQDPLPNDAFLWQAHQKLYGALPMCKNQGQLGSCVSFGTNGAIEDTMVCAIVYDKQPFEFKHIAEEATYGGSRVEIGGGKLGRGDGSVGAWAAKFAHDYGVIARDVYTIDGQTYDLTSYDVSRCRSWGNSGVPKGLETVAKQHPVQSTTLIASWADAKRALSQGYGIAVCSNQGFTMQRDANGVCRPSGTWGHCVPEGTMISTLIPKKAEDVRVGDLVTAHDGQQHRVLEVMPRAYSGELCVLKTFGTVPVEFTPDHPIYIYRPMHRGAGARAGIWGNDPAKYLSEAARQWDAEQPAWIAASDVLPGDYLMSPRVREYDGPAELPTWCSRPRTQNIPLPILSADPELAWLFGLYIADGSSEPGHKIVITLDTDELDLAERAVSVIAKKIGLHSRIKDCGNCFRVICDSADVADSFHDWFGSHPWEKHVPEFLFHGWDLSQLVAGELHGDGCSRKRSEKCPTRGHIVTTTSSRLAVQLHQILLSLGEYPSLQNQPRNGSEFPNARPGWVVTWNAGGTKHFMHHWQGFYLMPVRSVSRKEYTGTVYNYEVEGAHSYLSWNVISHNCMHLDGYHLDGNKEYGHIENSWGPSAMTGPVGWGTPSTAGFWADSGVVDRMIKAGDTWAFSSVVGFPSKHINWYASLGKAIRPVALKPFPNETLFASIP